MTVHPAESTFVGERRSRAPDRSSDAVRTAVKDTLAHAVALAPFALAIGAASAANGLTGVESVAGVLLLMAGSSLLASVELIGAGNGIAITAITAMVINLRFMLYGAAVNRWFGTLSRSKRLLLAFPIVDSTFLICDHRFEHHTDPIWRSRYYLTSTLVVVSTFVAGLVTGFWLSAGLPERLGLHLAAPLVFAGMLGKTVTGRRHVAAGAAAAIVVVVTAALPGGLAVPLAAGAGLTAGTLSGEHARKGRSR